MSRKKQIEKEFLGHIAKVMKERGVPLDRYARTLIKQELRGAAMVGAAEERFRTLRLIKEKGVINARDVCAEGVLSVLGYEKESQ